MNPWKLVVAMMRAMMKASRRGNATHVIPPTSEMLWSVLHALLKRAFGSTIVQTLKSACSQHGGTCSLLANQTNALWGTLRIAAVNLSAIDRDAFTCLMEFS
jgi:hypothetical protein